MSNQQQQHDQQHEHYRQYDQQRLSLSIASCREESIMISSSGDVIVCRCRKSSYPLVSSTADDNNNNNGSKRGRSHNNSNRIRWNIDDHSPTTSTRCGWNGYAWMASELALACCDTDVDNLSLSIYDDNVSGSYQHPHRHPTRTPTTSAATASGLCAPWISSSGRRSSTSQNNNSNMRYIGLRGGAPPAEVASPLHNNNHHHEQQQQYPSSSLLYNGERYVGLRGGSPAEVASPLHSNHQQQQHSSSSLLYSSNTSTRHNHGDDHNSNPMTDSPSTKTRKKQQQNRQQQSLMTSQRTADRSSTNNVVDYEQISSLSSRRATNNNTSPLSPRGSHHSSYNNINDDSIFPVQSFDYTLFYEDNISVESFVTEVTPHNNRRTSSNTSSNKNNSNNNNSRNHRDNSGVNSATCYGPNRIKVNTLLSSLSPTSYNNNNNIQQYQHQHYYQGGPEFVHGVPTFLNLFSNVKITKVSAHPLGSHVLLISNAGLLFAYGLNDYGQLGIGYRCKTTKQQNSTTNMNHGYVMTPTIVTPIVEHGGKAIACAAGVNHSLVVVETEEQRLIKKTSITSSSPNNNKEVIEVSCKPNKDSILSSSSSQSSASASATTSSVAQQQVTETVYHHQVYGFGRNNHFKIGLISPRMVKATTNTNKDTTPMPNGKTSKNRHSQKNGAKMDPIVVDDDEDEMEVVILPRRVSLRCTTVHHPIKSSSSQSPLNNNHDTTSLSYGIFAIEASVDHSAAIVRRPNGDIELYTWGDATHFALGIPTTQSTLLTSSSSHQSSSSTTANQQQQRPSMIRVVPVPSFVSSLSRIVHTTTDTTTISTKTSSSVSSSSSMLLQYDKGEYPINVSLGPKCTFIITSLGRCFSFGSCSNGMLGHGVNIIEMRNPKEIIISNNNNNITNISAGSSHVVATTLSGHVYGWGMKQYIGVEQHNSVSSTIPQQQQQPVSSRTESNSRTTHNTIIDSQLIQWTPIQLNIIESLFYVMKENRSNNYQQQNQTLLHDETTILRDENVFIIKAQAGYDCTYFVTEFGKVYSCGIKSGRLGQGDNNDDNDDDNTNNDMNSISNNNKHKQQQEHLTVIENHHHANNNATMDDNNNLKLDNNDNDIVSQPKPLFGGLHLFWKQRKTTSSMMIQRHYPIIDMPSSSSLQNNNNSKMNNNVGGGIPKSTTTSSNNNTNQSLLLQTRPMFQKSRSIR